MPECVAGCVDSTAKIFVHTHTETTSENGQEGVKDRLIVASLVTALSHLGVKAVPTGKFGDAEEGCGLEWLLIFTFHSVHQLLQVWECATTCSEP